MMMGEQPLDCTLGASVLMLTGSATGSPVGRGSRAGLKTKGNCGVLMPAAAAAACKARE